MATADPDARPLPAPRPAPGTPRRLFFPGGDGARTWTEPEHRTALDQRIVDQLRAIVDTELLGRAAHHPGFDVALIDARLAEIPAPLRERAASGQLASWPRGTFVDLPGGDVLRLFLHWTDAPGTRVDLDLSCAFFDDHWAHVGHVDYTNLRFDGERAVHSGDLTSAPPPLGATEYIDLHLPALAGRARWALPIVFSFNDVPFELLEGAFAGFAVPTVAGATFDPARVAQRFDLRGNARILASMVIDLAGRQALWTDVNLTATGYGHSVARNTSSLGHLGADLWEHFAAGRRPTVLDVVGWHACARAAETYVLHGDGSLTPIGSTIPVRAMAELRAAAELDTGPIAMPTVTGRRVLVAVADAATADALALHEIADGSVALTASGPPPAAGAPVTVGDLLAGLVPRSA